LGFSKKFRRGLNLRNIQIPDLGQIFCECSNVFVWVGKLHPFRSWPTNELIVGTDVEQPRIAGSTEAQQRIYF
jgi:phage major head subunit gpT-like protein